MEPSSKMTESRASPNQRQLKHEITTNLRMMKSGREMKQLIHTVSRFYLLSFREFELTWKHDQPTHDEKWERDKAADSYGTATFTVATRKWKQLKNDSIIQ